MRDAARRAILERRSAFMVAALVAGGPCERVRDWVMHEDAGPEQVEEEDRTPPQPKSCLGYRHVPTPEELAKPDAATDAEAPADAARG